MAVTRILFALTFVGLLACSGQSEDASTPFRVGTFAGGNSEALFVVRIQDVHGSGEYSIYYVAPGAVTVSRADYTLRPLGGSTFSVRHGASDCGNFRLSMSKDLLTVTSAAVSLRFAPVDEKTVTDTLEVFHENAEANRRYRGPIPHGAPPTPVCHG